jgi:predicted nuclease with TOPRIM domain
MAQDFHAAFPLDESDTTLNDADLHGVALAAIQGLNEKVESENASLRDELSRRDAENAELKQRLERLEKLMLNKQSH